MSKPFFDDLDFSQPILVSCSGGRDSTAMCLGLKEYIDENKISKENIKILFGNTRVNLGSARNAIKKLVEYTGFELIVVQYEGKRKAIDILNDSFRRIPLAMDRIDEGKQIKNVFPCCRILKDKPLSDYAKSLKLLDGDPFVLLGFNASDKSLHRVRIKNEKIHQKRIKATGIIHHYPIIQCSESDLFPLLKRHGFENTKSSGCSICPYFVVFDSWRKKDIHSWERSRNKAKQLGVDPRPTNQESLIAHCPDIFDIDTETDFIESIQAEFD